jgi:hypothetical protein
MGYQQIDTNLTLAEISLMRSMEHNRSLRMMEKIIGCANLSGYCRGWDFIKSCDTYYVSMYIWGADQVIAEDGPLITNPLLLFQARPYNTENDSETD